jgi:hypothetical protein
VTIDKDEKGKPTAVRVVVVEMVYWDLNVDGVFDAFYDRVKNQSSIALDGKIVQVEGAKNFPSTRSARSQDHSVNYVFEGGRWRVGK